MKEKIELDQKQINYVAACLEDMLEEVGEENHNCIMVHFYQILKWAGVHSYSIVKVLEMVEVDRSRIVEYIRISEGW